MQKGAVSGGGYFLLVFSQHPSLVSVAFRVRLAGREHTDGKEDACGGCVGITVCVLVASGPFRWRQRRRHLPTEAITAAEGAGMLQRIVIS